MRVWHILLIVALALVGQAPARAALTGFTLTNPDQSGFVGDLLTFEGTVTNDNTTGDVFINNYVMSGDPDLATALSFLFPPNLDQLGAAETDTGDIFMVDLTGMTPGTYNGTITLQGGIDGTEFNDLISTNFSVTVQDASGGATPEPATVALMGAGLALAGARRRRRARGTSAA